MTTIRLNESGWDTGMDFSHYCEKVVAAGYDDPRDYGDDPEKFVFVSKSYAQADPAWDVDENWPDELPVWEYRPFGG